MFATKTLTLTNKGNCDVEFRFREFRGESLFSMLPMTGFVKPYGGTFDVEFKYIPKGKNEEEDITLLPYAATYIILITIISSYSEYCMSKSYPYAHKYGENVLQTMGMVESCEIYMATKVA